MHHFHDRPGPPGLELWCEEVPLSRIADAVGTPVYVYASATLAHHYAVFVRAFAPRDVSVAYAVKANSSLAVLATLARLGAGADTVSEGEIRRALAAGVPASRIVFSGVGKTDAELAFALDAGVSEINLESELELHRLAAIAADKGVRATVALRVNPDVGAGGHAKITTGSDENKFGVSASEVERLYARACALPQFDVAGLACHIGSQITEFAPLRAAFAAMRTLVERLRAGGLPVRRLDLGGGLGVPYGDAPPPPTPADYARAVLDTVGDLEVELAFEPGRLIVANAGVLLSRVIQVHTRPSGRRFLVLDAAMNDLLRPALYDAHHAIRPVRTPEPGAVERPYDVVGPVCETGDTFARDRRLPDLAAGDLVALMTAGAYGASMSSEYNSRPLVPEVLVKGADYAVTRPRPSYEEMLGRERRAPWLG
ncbi:diaminopimelate decarboxylase [Caulobacter sp. S45]|uniref:diaminopimelate decarboxylase n=1 Tax=Caulobacter sp. S45 TaxID=1641861 RepID=UPI00157568B1|nr:diaminopimelate decarboxylase [Caulobacter sp. S45]